MYFLYIVSYFGLLIFIYFPIDADLAFNEYVYHTMTLFEKAQHSGKVYEIQIFVSLCHTIILNLYSAIISNLNSDNNWSYKSR